MDILKLGNNMYLVLSQSFYSFLRGCLNFDLDQTAVPIS